MGPVMNKNPVPMSTRWRVEFRRHDGSIVAKHFHNPDYARLKRSEIMAEAETVVNSDPYLRDIKSVKAVGLNG